MEQAAHVALEQRGKRLLACQVGRDPLHLVPLEVEVARATQVVRFLGVVGALEVGSPYLAALLDEMFDEVGPREPARTGHYVCLQNALPLESLSAA